MAFRLWMALTVVFAAYIACVSAGYVWDDHLLILQNDALTAPTLRKLLASDLWCCTQELRGSGYWRPLTTLSFFADIAGFGAVPGPAHLQSLCWHLLCTGLVGRLVAGRPSKLTRVVPEVKASARPRQRLPVGWAKAQANASGFMRALLHPRLGARCRRSRQGNACRVRTTG